MRNWTNWEALVESILYLETTQHPKVKRWIRGNTKFGPALEVAVSHHRVRYGIEIMINSSVLRWNLFLGDGREWNKQIRDRNDGGNPAKPHRDWKKVQGNLLLKQYRHKTSMPTTLLLQRLRCHITSVSGSTSNKVGTTKPVWKCQKR